MLACFGWSVVVVIVCKVCIYNYFVENGKIRRHSCPVCEVELSANPLETLRQDLSLQTIVDTCFPQFSEEEQALDYAPKSSSDSSASNQGSQSTSAGSQSAAAATSMTREGATVVPPANAGKIVHGFYYSDKVTFKLIPAESCASDDRLRLPKPYIATTGRATVKQLIQFIVQSVNAAAKDLNVQPEQVCHKNKLQHGCMQFNIHNDMSFQMLNRYQSVIVDRRSCLKTR